MKKKLLTLAILGSLSVGVFAQDPSNNIEITAEVDAGCSLIAENINFGVLAMPLSDQSAQSRIRVHCSKGANLIMGISYSEQAGSSIMGNIYTLDLDTNQGYSQYAKLLINGVPSGGPYSHDMRCAQENYKQIRLMSQLARDLFGYSNIKTSVLVPDTYKICKDSSASFRYGMEKNINTIIHQIQVGFLTGISQGEQIKYSLEVPEQSSLLWNTSNTYNFVGSGVEQIIPMKANIKRAENQTHRMTPDTYQSTLTVILNY